jgi:caspase 7
MASKDYQVNPSKYMMDQKKRGIALVININKYEPNPFKLEKREWSIKDVESLKITLEYLEFDIELVENSTKSQIEQRLKKIATNINHEHFDCFLCVVMSHGINDSFATSNSELMSFEEIMAPIKSCPSLSNKPKMFFFQACRGEKEMESTLKSRINSASSIQPSKGLLMTDSVPSSNTEKIATNFNGESDLLIYYSTLPDHYSYSNNQAVGTTFIQSFCDVFNDAYKNLPHNLSLTQMIIRINESVSNKRMQISVPELRMNKDIFFCPKNVSLLIKFLKIKFN